jgi:glycosyltransferase involved in cell wall biosynthesis
MRVAFDTAPLTRRYPFGVRRACRELVEALEERSVLEVVRLTPKEGESERSWRQGRLPRAIEELACEGLHSPVSAFPWRGGGRRVQTVHELPWRHGVTENAGPAHRFWASYGSWRADAVLCPTEVVARDLRDVAPLGSAKVQTCPWGISSRFTEERTSEDQDEALRESYQLPAEPFALCLGANRAKKNLPSVLHGIDALRGRGTPLHLVVTGRRTEALENDLQLASRLALAKYVHTPGEIAEHHLPALLRMASVVAVLSHSEGFGFPVLEAMSCGTPVVVPVRSAQAEVAGDVGIEVDTRSEAAVAAGLWRATREREALRPRLLERAKKFSWERCARQVEELWLGWKL